MSETITVELRKEDIMRMICGSTMPPKGIPLVTKFVGTPEAPDYAWDLDELAQMAIGELMQLYALMNWSAPPEEVDAPRIMLL